jgi:two-component system NtrC family response regulator
MSSPAQLDRLLIVEDDTGLQRQLKWCFEGYEVLFAENRTTAMAHMRRAEPVVVLQDLGLPPDAEGVTEGVALLGEILAAAPHTKVIVVTGNQDKDNAVRAVGLGAYDFYQKPLDVEVLRLIVRRAFTLHKLELENRRLQTAGRSPLAGVIAMSDPMIAVCRKIEKVAPTQATTLLLGESGTGKELLARALHELSVRANGPFIAINCAAIPETLLESELFGYEKGAFTGAHKQTRGKLESADRGTLFLDEVGDMPLALQAKLLRFLQERVIQRIGGTENIPLDLRVVCATNRELKAMIEKGEFRSDLYYRISEVTVAIPPLREREADNIVIAQAILDRSAREHGRPIRGFSPDGIRAIQGYPWPGNIRELENKIRGAVIMAEGKQVTAADLGLDATDQIDPAFFNLRVVRQQAERRAVLRALAICKGNLSRAAELLGITRPTLYDLMEKNELSADMGQVGAP